MLICGISVPEHGKGNRDASNLTGRSPSHSRYPCSFFPSSHCPIIPLFVDSLTPSLPIHPSIHLTMHRHSQKIWEEGVEWTLQEVVIALYEPSLYKELVSPRPEKIIMAGKSLLRCNGKPPLLFSNPDAPTGSSAELPGCPQIRHGPSMRPSISHGAVTLMLASTGSSGYLDGWRPIPYPRYA